jgi:ribosomal protein L33
MPDLTLEVINDKELLKLFNELIPKVQSKIIAGGFRTASKIILDQAKINFHATKKGKSRTGYAGINSMFKSKPLRAPKIGAVVGLSSKEGYKYRFENYGTEDRFYMTKNNKKHETGKIKATKFFDNAVEAKQEAANRAISEAIVDSLKKTIIKYDKKYRL